MTEIDSAFTTRRVAHTFVALDRSAATVRTEHQFELVARRADRFYVREYTWVSEEGLEKAPIIHSGHEENGMRSHRLHGPIVEGNDGKRLAVIDLGRVVEQGQTETVELEHFFVCTSPKNPGFVGHRARSGCEEITLRAVLPDGAGKRVRFRSFRAGADDSYKDIVLEPTAVGDLLSELQRESDWQEYRYVVTDPIPDERYRIVWDI